MKISKRGMVVFSCLFLFGGGNYFQSLLPFFFTYS